MKRGKKKSFLVSI